MDGYADAFSNIHIWICIYKLIDTKPRYFGVYRREINNKQATINNYKCVEWITDNWLQTADGWWRWHQDCIIQVISDNDKR